MIHTQEPWTIKTEGDLFKTEGDSMDRWVVLLCPISIWRDKEWSQMWMIHKQEPWTMNKFVPTYTG
jgi:hypothetical protein